MKKPEMTVLKIGGSVITDKNEKMAARTKDIDRLAGEIHKSDTQNLIIVHGGGSFGHPFAQKYRINEGFKDNSQKIGFSETHNVMTVLNGLLMACLIEHNVPAVSIAPSSCIITENGKISHFDDSIIKDLLKMSFTPVLYGDAVLDAKQGFAILSGDQLVTSLAVRFNAERIVIGVDVDGLYDADPKVEKTARMLSHLTLEELKELQGKLCKPKSCDVTGGMLGKVRELLPAAEYGIPITFVNASKPENICRVLGGKKVEGTLITKG